MSFSKYVGRRSSGTKQRCIGILIEFYDLLRLLKVKGYVKNTKRETDLAFGDLIGILSIVIILASCSEYSLEYLFIGYTRSLFSCS